MPLEWVAHKDHSPPRSVQEPPCGRLPPIAIMRKLGEGQITPSGSRSHQGEPMGSGPGLYELLRTPLGRSSPRINLSKYIHVISAGSEPMSERVRHGHRL